MLKKKHTFCFRSFFEEDDEEGGFVAVDAITPTVLLAGGDDDDVVPISTMLSVDETADISSSCRTLRS